MGHTNGIQREEEEPAEETQGEGGKTHRGWWSGCQVENMFERPEQINWGKS